MGRLQLIPALVAVLLCSSGCLVQSQCWDDSDCAASEQCNKGQCYVECVNDKDCWVGGVNLGKQCRRNRCEFPYEERVDAPNFCLEVVNPRSSLHGQDFCLSAMKGKVVALYFAWLT